MISTVLSRTFLSAGSAISKINALKLLEDVFLKAEIGCLQVVMTAELRDHFESVAVSSDK